MKVFFDTNIILEFICGRQQAQVVQQLIFSLIQERHKLLTSAAGMYTITYIYELFLKNKGEVNPQKQQFLRDKISDLCNLFDFLPTLKENFMAAVNDERFKDLEDSYQYQTALSGDCDCIVTLNTKDFKTDTSSPPTIYTPQEFIDHLSASSA